jgi:hypothetical protein
VKGGGRPAADDVMPKPRSYLADHADRLGDKPAVIDDRPDGTLTVWTFTELNR